MTIDLIVVAAGPRTATASGSASMAAMKPTLRKSSP
jgi:hypothetical protein